MSLEYKEVGSFEKETLSDSYVAPLYKGTLSNTAIVILWKE